MVGRATFKRTPQDPSEDLRKHSPHSPLPPRPEAAEAPSVPSTWRSPTPRDSRSATPWQVEVEARGAPWGPCLPVEPKGRPGPAEGSSQAFSSPFLIRQPPSGKKTQSGRFHLVHVACCLFREFLGWFSLAVVSSGNHVLISYRSEQMCRTCEPGSFWGGHVPKAQQVGETWNVKDSKVKFDGSPAGSAAPHRRALRPQKPGSVCTCLHTLPRQCCGELVFKTLGQGVSLQ